MNNSYNRILVLEPEEVCSKAINFQLKKQGYESAFASSMEEAESMLHKEHFSLMIGNWDMMSSDMSSLISAMSVQMPVILTSSHWKNDSLLKAMECGFQDFMSLPTKNTEIAFRVGRWIKTVLN